ncbi:MAG: hypothetical protein PHI66_00120 [Candidatus Pacebacteria bacterium]|nr:hypothetical protein [Candidatus Paceibacterota bacterium]
MKKIGVYKTGAIALLVVLLVCFLVTPVVAKTTEYAKLEKFYVVKDTADADTYHGKAHLSANAEDKYEYNWAVQDVAKGKWVFLVTKNEIKRGSYYKSLPLNGESVVGCYDTYCYRLNIYYKGGKLHSTYLVSVKCPKDYNGMVTEI